MNQVFVKTDDLKEKVFDVKLKIPEWKVLFAIDGKMGSQELASFLDMPASDVETTLAKLQNLNCITPKDASHRGEAAESREESPAGQEGVPRETGTPEADPPDPEVETAVAGETEERAGEEDEVFELDEEAEFEDFLSEEGEQETGQETSGEDSDEDGDEDLEKLIGNILEEDTEEYSSDSGGIEKAEETEEGEEEFDLDSIFEEDVAEATAEAEEEVDTLDEDSEEVEAPPVEKAPPSPEAPATILVVDDSVVIRKMVEIALENESYTIISVATGKEALNFLDENTPDLIILDIMLSDVNGLDVLKAIKASKQIPVVMLSAKDTPRETSKAKELGADDFIPKPFKDEELVGKIKELIKQ